MVDIISIGGATIDIFVKPKETNIIRLTSKDLDECRELLCFDYGNKIKIDDVHETFGGGASNTSIGFHRLGLTSAIISLVGEDEWGKKIIKNLREEGVQTDNIFKTNKYKSSFSVIINSFEGDRTVLYFPGANKMLKKADIDKASFSNTKWLFINRVASSDTNILTYLEKKISNSQSIAWNPGGYQIKQGINKYRSLLKKTDILFLNKEEASSFTNISYSKYNDRIYYNLTEIFNKIQTYGVKITVITDGKRGAQVYDGKEIYYCPIETDNRKDTLGAGDAFATGFTYAYIQSLSLKKCLIFGTINATSVVNSYGAEEGLLTKRQMQDRYEKTKLKTINITKTK